MSQSSTNTSLSPWPHRWAVALCCATFPLIWVGALVTTYDAGMAVEDWPGTRGYNLFLYPWSVWLTGPFDVFIEHSHRLLGSLAGMLTIATLVSIFWAGGSRTMKVLGVVTLLAVIGQGVLGGMRVLFDARTLAMIHACTGPAFFCLACVLAIITSRRWQLAAGAESEIDRSLFIQTAITAALAYIQLCFGALLRHVPVDAGPQWFRLAVLFHILTALLLAGHVLATSWRMSRMKNNPWLCRPAQALPLLIGVQLMLGMATWVVKYAWPAALGDFNFAADYTITANSLWQSYIVNSHVAVGSLILATSVVLAVRTGRSTKWVTANRPLELSLRGVMA